MTKQIKTILAVASIGFMGCVAPQKPAVKSVETETQAINLTHAGHTGLCNLGMLPDGRFEEIHWCDCGSKWTNIWPGRK